MTTPITGAGPLLNPSPARPGGPGPTPADGGTPALTQQQQGAAELADLKGNPDFVKRYLAGEPEAKAKMAAAVEKAMAPSGVIVNGNPAALNERALNSLSTFADLPDAVQQQVRAGTPVSEAEYTAAVRRRAQLMADSDWSERYLRGDRAARQELALCNIILGSKLALEKRAR